jgi:hypothetical protein
MSKLIALRIPDDLMEEIEKRANGGNVSQTIIGMLRGNSIQVVKVEEENPKPVEMIIPKPERAKKAAKPKGKQPCDHHATGDDEPITREIESAREAEVEKPAVSGGCRKHPDGPGWAKAGGWWCITCGKIV